MTKSNKTYLNLSRNTTIALSLAGVAILASCLLILQVNSLDRKYGRVEENIGYYTQELEAARQQLESTRIQYRELSDQNQNMLEKVAGAENSLQSAVQREADATERLKAIQDDITSEQGRLSQALLTIAESARLERENTQALTIKNDLETQVVNLEDDLKELEERQQELAAKTAQSETANDRLEGRLEERQRELDLLMPAVENLRAQERRVAQLRDDESRLENRITELTTEENDARNKLAALMVQIDAETQRLNGREQELTAAQIRFAELESELAELQERKVEMDVKVLDAEARFSELQSQAEIAQRALTRNQAQLSETTASVNLAQEQLSIAQAELTTLETLIESALEELADVNQRRAEFNGLQAEVARLQSRKSELDRDLPDLIARAELARSTFASTREDGEAELERIAGLKGRASSLEADIARLQERRDEFQERTDAARVAAEEARATLQELRSELGQLDALLQARNDDLSRRAGQISSQEEILNSLRIQIEAAEPSMTPNEDNPNANE